MSYQSLSASDHKSAGNGAPVSPLATSLRLELWGETNKGRVREGNEDAIYPANSGTNPVNFVPGPEKLAQHGQLFIVADGVGGGAAGREASHWAIRVAVERYYDAPGVDLLADLQSAVVTANASLFQYLQSLNTAQAGTTMVAAAILGNRLYYVNAGDSRAYLIRGGASYRLTRDHTLVQRKIDAGQLTPEAAELDPDRNVITRSLGAAPQLEVDAFPPLDLQSGDVILLCSDGLTDMVADPELVRLVGGDDPRKAAHKLVSAANRAGGVDNVSVVLARVGGKSRAGNGNGASSKGLNLQGLRADWSKMSRGQRRFLSLMAALVILTVLVVCGIIGWNLVEPKNGGSGATVIATPTVALPTSEAPSGGVATLEGAPTEISAEGTSAPADGRPTSTPRPTATPTPTRTPRGWRPIVTEPTPEPTTEAAPAPTTEAPTAPATEPPPTESPTVPTPKTPTAPPTNPIVAPPTTPL